MPVTNQPLLAYQSVHDAYGERAPAKSESEDIVALVGAVYLLAVLLFRGGGFERQIVEMRAIIPAGKLVDIEHVSLQAKAEGAAEDRKGGLKEEVPTPSS